MLFGSKSVRGLLPMLEQLPPLSDHPNRELQTRDVFVAHLLAFFNPTLRSLRTLEDFSQTRQARRYLTVERLPKSTLADFHRLVDPAVLEPIVAHLVQETARRGVAAPADLPDSIRQVLAVDGTFLALAADVAWAVRHRTNTGQGQRPDRCPPGRGPRVAPGRQRPRRRHQRAGLGHARDRPGGRPRL
jgi:hypothetical protein